MPSSADRSGASGCGRRVSLKRRTSAASLASRKISVGLRPRHRPQRREHARELLEQDVPSRTSMTTAAFSISRVRPHRQLGERRQQRDRQVVDAEVAEVLERAHRLRLAGAGQAGEDDEAMRRRAPRPRPRARAARRSRAGARRRRARCAAGSASSSASAVRSAASSGSSADAGVQRPARDRGAPPAAAPRGRRAPAAAGCAPRPRPGWRGCGPARPACRPSGIGTPRISSKVSSRPSRSYSRPDPSVPA